MLILIWYLRQYKRLYFFQIWIYQAVEFVGLSFHLFCHLSQIRTYSEWVIDGEYDWPPKCCQCQAILEEGNGSQTTRLGCLRMRYCFSVPLNLILLNLHWLHIFIKGQPGATTGYTLSIWILCRCYPHKLPGLSYQEFSSTYCPSRICLSFMFLFGKIFTFK